MFYKLFQNEKGETLTSVIMASAISMIVILTTTEVLRQQQAAQISNEQAVALNLYQADVEAFLRNKNVCLENFSPGTVDPDNDPTNAAIPTNQKLNQLVKQGAADARFVPNAPIAAGKLNVAPTEAFVLMDSPNVINAKEIGQMSLKITVQKKNSIFGTTDVVRYIPVAIKTGDTGMIDYCSTIGVKPPFDCILKQAGSGSAQVVICDVGYTIFSGSGSAQRINDDNGYYQMPEVQTYYDPVTKISTSVSAWKCEVTGKGNVNSCTAFCCRE